MRDSQEENEADREEMADSKNREGASAAEDDMTQVTSRDGHGGDEEAVGEWVVLKEGGGRWEVEGGRWGGGR